MSTSLGTRREKPAVSNHYSHREQDENDDETPRVDYESILSSL